MKTDFAVKALLAGIFILLAIIALRPLSNPMPVQAQEMTPRYWIEPGVMTLRAPDGSREVAGRVVVDMRTGNIWGYPTGMFTAYPVDTSKSTPPVSRPFYLGKFDFQAMERDSQVTGTP